MRERNSLAHYGVLGMKWGVRRYQPYPKGHKGGTYKGPKSGYAKRYEGKVARLQKKADMISKSGKSTSSVKKLAIVDSKVERAKQKYEKKTDKRIISERNKFAEDFNKTSGTIDSYNKGANTVNKHVDRFNKMTVYKPLNPDGSYNDAYTMAANDFVDKMHKYSQNKEQLKLLNSSENIKNLEKLMSTSTSDLSKEARKFISEGRTHLEKSIKDTEKYLEMLYDEPYNIIRSRGG